MSVAVTATVGLSILAQYLESISGGFFNANATIGSGNFLNFPFTAGTGAAGAINQVYFTQGTIATSSSATIDLYAFGGALDPGGNAYTQAKIKLIFIQNLGYVTSPVETDLMTVGPGASNGWTALVAGTTPTITLKSPVGTTGIPGTLLAVDAGLGYAVTNGSNYELKLANTVSANTITYNLLVLGSTS